MFISESVDGQAKPEPMDQETVSHPQASAKVSDLVDVAVCGTPVPH